MTRASKGRSAVTNGRRLFLTKTPRSPQSRRLRDLLDQLFNDRGGKEGLSIETQAACRTYAALCVQQEIILGKLAAGEAVESSDLTRIAASLERARRAMGEPVSKRPTARKGRIVSTTSGTGVPPNGAAAP